MELEQVKEIPKWQEERRKGKLIEIDYVRTFLGHDAVFVPIYQVLLFFVTQDIYLGNPFMKNAMASVAYNGIKIIAIDDCPFQKTKDEYKKILKDYGYEHIDEIASQSEIKAKVGTLQFYKKVMEQYNPEKKKCGLVGRHLNVYAKLNHMSFLLYSSPDIYVRRYLFQKKNGMEEVVEKFINFQMFDGVRIETNGYHFGYSFVGIFLYVWAVYLKKKAKGRPIYFLWNARHIYEAYVKIYPEDEVSMVYQEEEAYAEQDGIVVNADTDVKELFSKNVYKKKKTKIKQMLGKITGNIKIEDEDHEKREEIHRGYMGFIEEFCGFLKEHPTLDETQLLVDGRFVADVIEYAFDEKRQEKAKYDMMQLLTETKTAKNFLLILRRIYRKLRGK